MIRPALAFLAPALLCAAGCQPDFTASARLLGRRAPEIPEREPVLERRREYHDAAATRLEREWRVLILADGSTVLHGQEREWYPEGGLRAEREHEHGEPAGRWRTWYADGTLRSDVSYAAEPTTASYWHPSGQLSAEGPLADGRREGEWRTWHEDGSLASQGRYLGSLRTGEWTFWHPGGSVRWRALFRAGEAVQRLEGDASGLLPR